MDDAYILNIIKCATGKESIGNKDNEYWMLAMVLIEHGSTEWLGGILSAYGRVPKQRATDDAMRVVSHFELEPDEFFLEFEDDLGDFRAALQNCGLPNPS